VRKSLTLHYLTDLLLVKIELLVKILCIFWFIVFLYYACFYLRVNKDAYINAHFGIKYLENLVANRRNRFISRYGETDNYLCQMLRRLVRLSGCIFIYCVCLISVLLFYNNVGFRLNNK